MWPSYRPYYGMVMYVPVFEPFGPTVPGRKVTETSNLVEIFSLERLTAPFLERKVKAYIAPAVPPQT